MLDTWIVVADGSHCRIFSSEVELAELSVVKEMKNDHHAGHHRGHSAKGHDSAHHAEEAKFAADVASEINRAVGAHEVRDVLLVAPRRFMGDLTASLSKATVAHVTGKVHKDFTAIERHELARRLREALASGSLTA